MALPARHLVPIALLGAALGLSACRGGPEPDAPVTESNLTAGMVKRTIAVGRTSQAEVLEVFGPPDLVTHRDGREIWTYDKIRHEIEAESGYFTVLIAGTGSRRTTRSSTSTMLIVYFEDEIVRDYRLSVARF